MQSTEFNVRGLTFNGTQPGYWFRVSGFELVGRVTPCAPVRIAAFFEVQGSMTVLGIGRLLSTRGTEA